MTHQQQLDHDEESSIADRRRRDIDLYGYAGAFRIDSVMTFEKYEWEKENNRLRGEM